MRESDHTSVPPEMVASIRRASVAPVAAPLWTRNAEVSVPGLRAPVMSMMVTAGGAALFCVVWSTPSIGLSETSRYQVPESESAGLVVSPNLKYHQVLPAAIAPPAPVVTTGNWSQLERSWTHCWVVGFQMNPRLVPPDGVAVGLMRSLT